MRFQELVTLPHQSIQDRSTSENRDLTLGIPRHFAKTGTHRGQVRDTAPLPPFLLFLSISISLPPALEGDAHAHVLRVTHRTAFAANNYVGDFSVAVRSSLSLSLSLTRSFPLPSRFSL